MIDYANDFLYQEMQKLPDTFIIYYDKTITTMGKQNAIPGKYWFIGRIPYSPELARELCKNVLGAYLFLEGKTIRLIITDLDNTIWEGIIGEDGISGIQLNSDYPGNCFMSFQKLLLEWKKQGKILAIVSKNTELIALEAIEKHPGMILKKEDFVSLKINWNNKVDNITELSNELNLGLSGAPL